MSCVQEEWLSKNDKNPTFFLIQGTVKNFIMIINDSKTIFITLTLTSFYTSNIVYYNYNIQYSMLQYPLCIKSSSNFIVN